MRRPAALLVALCLAACGEGPPEDGGDEKQPASRTPVRGTEAPDQSPVKALWAGVDGGEWTLGEGLVASLKVAAGEVRSGDVHGQPVTYWEITGLLQTARGYLRGAEDSPIRREVRRLLDKVAPSPDAYRQRATPAPGERQSRLPDGRALTWLLPAARAAPGDCETVADPDCAYRDSWRHDGVEHEAFYPKAWDDEADHGRREYLPWTRAAVNDAQEAFGEFGGMRAVTVLLGMGEEGREGRTTNASADLDEETGRCVVYVYEDGLEKDEKPYRQIIAHELFHCFQLWNLPGSGGTARGYEVGEWWIEGSAEYFSNVVYPAVNLEWDWADEFDDDADETPLYRMSYEATFFFQHLANAVGNARIVDYLGGLPDGGSASDQAAALAGWGDMQNRFHDFGRTYLDGKIGDTGGGYIFWLEPDTGLPLEIDRGGTYPLVTDDTEVFILDFSGLAFDEGRAPYRLEADPTGPPSRHSVKPLPEGAWRNVPPRMPSACGDFEEYRVLVTRAAAPGATHGVDLEVREEAPDASAPPGEVDSCLTGRWRADAESLDESLASMARGLSGFREVESEAASWVCFDDAGFVEGYVDVRSRWRMIMTGEPSRPMRTEVTIRGPFSNRYGIDGGRIELSNQSNAVTADSRLWLDGEYIGEGGTVYMPEPWRESASSDIYRCSGDRLEWTPPVPGMRPEPVVYARIPEDEPLPETAAGSHGGSGEGASGAETDTSECRFAEIYTPGAWEHVDECVDKCRYACLLDHPSMCGREAATMAECERYSPEGTKLVSPDGSAIRGRLRREEGLPTKTLCRVRFDSRRRHDIRPMRKQDVLLEHCEARCKRRCNETDKYLFPADSCAMNTTSDDYAGCLSHGGEG